MPESGFASGLRIIFSIGAVFALLFLFRYFLLQGGVRGGSETKALLRVREQIALGPRARLMLIEIADRFFLVVMNGDAISTTELQGFHMPERPAKGESAYPSFAKQLQDILTSFKQGGHG